MTREARIISSTIHFFQSRRSQSIMAWTHSKEPQKSVIFPSTWRWPIILIIEAAASHQFSIARSSLLRPSRTRSHAAEDQATLSMERSFTKTSDAILALAKSQATPLGTAITRATERISDLPIVQSLSSWYRIAMIKRFPFDGNAEIIFGLAEDDLGPFVASMLRDFSQSLPTVSLHVPQSTFDGMKNQ